MYILMVRALLKYKFDKLVAINLVAEYSHFSKPETSLNRVETNAEESKRLCKVGPIPAEHHWVVTPTGPHSRDIMSP